jgi:hypothetical protein
MTKVVFGGFLCNLSPEPTEGAAIGRQKGRMAGFPDVIGVIGFKGYLFTK